MKPYKLFKDLHKDKVGLLLCNGLSLGSVPIDFLQKHLTLGSNSVYCYPNLVVNYYFIEGARHLRKAKMRQARIPYVVKVAHKGGSSFINRRFIHYFAHIPNTYSIDYKYYQGYNYGGWSFEPLEQHGTGASVTYCMLQVAYYMGFDPILIVGMDHKFDDGRWHFYSDEQSPEFETMTLDEYDSWRQRAEPAYRLARTHFWDAGRTLLNLTPDTACDVFEKDDLANWRER